MRSRLLARLKSIKMLLESIQPLTAVCFERALLQEQGVRGGWHA